MYYHKLAHIVKGYYTPFFCSFLVPQDNPVLNESGNNLSLILNPKKYVLCIKKRVKFKNKILGTKIKLSYFIHFCIKDLFYFLLEHKISYKENMSNFSVLKNILFSI